MIKARLKFYPSRRLRAGQGRHRITGTWVYTVEAFVNGKKAVVLTDNTGGTASKIPASLFEAAWLDATLANRLDRAGHRFNKSWREVVDEV